MKVHGPKTPKEESAVKPKKTVKPKKAKAKGESEGEDESPKVEEKLMTETERKEKREKTGRLILSPITSHRRLIDIRSPLSPS